MLHVSIAMAWNSAEQEGNPNPCLALVSRSISFVMALTIQLKNAAGFLRISKTGLLDVEVRTQTLLHSIRSSAQLISTLFLVIQGRVHLVHSTENSANRLATVPVGMQHDEIP
jgi:hypothetical protein